MYVGIADLQNQIHRHAIRKGFRMNLLLLGEPSLGKSTFVHTLFDYILKPDSDITVETSTGNKESDSNLHLSTSSYIAQENEVKLHLTVTTVENFGMALDNSDSWNKISEFLDDQFISYLKFEHSVDRDVNFCDPRIHCCFYFFSPKNGRVSHLDVQTMKRIHLKVNLIPILAKADSYTEREMKEVKANILDQLKKNNISPFPEILSQHAENRRYEQFMPFSVITGCDVSDTNAKRMYGRNYPWGFLDVLDTSVSDFRYLRDYFLKVMMYSLIECTNDIIYNKVRNAYLMGRDLSDDHLFDEDSDELIYEQAKRKVDERIEKYKEELTLQYEQKLYVENQELNQLKQTLHEESLRTSSRIDKENSSCKESILESSKYFMA